jgi:hypothetical protein
MVVIIFLFIVVINNEQKKWKSSYMWSAVIQFLHAKSVHLVKINGQIVEGKWWISNEWREGENMSKCCWLFKEGRVNVDDKVGSWTVEVWNLWAFSIQSHSCTKSLSHVSQPQEFFWLPSPRIDQETDVVQDWLRGLAATFLDEGIQKLFPVWQVL